MISSQFILLPGTRMDCGVQIEHTVHRFITRFDNPITCYDASVAVMMRVVESMPADNNVPMAALELFHSQIHNTLVQTYHKQQGNIIEE